MFLCLVLLQNSLRLFSILYILFSFSCSLAIIHIIVSSSSVIGSSASVILSLIPSRVFSISGTVLFVAICSLVRLDPCSMLFAVYPFYFEGFHLNFILSLFAIITLNTFGDRLPIFYSFIWYCRLLPWLFHL